MDEARLEDVGVGLMPATEGWFAVNVRDVAWMVHPRFGARCVFEGHPRLLDDPPSDFEPVGFPDMGIRLQVLEPGQSSTLYHAETAQEGFLVLAGECVAAIDGQQRRLRAWDFLHLPAGTQHGFTGAGDEACVILMLGARPPGRTILYTPTDVTASVETETDSPGEAYAPYGHWRPGPPPAGPWDG
jgi:uncharacterized cupin superfamily protein